MWIIQLNLSLKRVLSNSVIPAAREGVAGDLLQNCCRIRDAAMCLEMRGANGSHGEEWVLARSDDSKRAAYDEAGGAAGAPSKKCVRRTPVHVALRLRQN